jgi:hypothetical protein
MPMEEEVIFAANSTGISTMSKRIVGRPFRKAQSGNPNGRPKVVQSFVDLARSHTTEAIGTIVAIMKDSNASPAARVSAACALLDRGWGKPAQMVTANVQEKRSIRQWSTEELTEFLNDATGRS